MNLGKAEEFFGTKFEADAGALVKGNLLSLRVSSENGILTAMLVRDTKDMFIRVDPVDPDQAFPLGEYAVKCDDFAIVQAKGIGPVLIFEYEGVRNNFIAITKTENGFSISARFDHDT